MEEITIICESEESIDIMDESTWGEHDFTRARDLVWNCVGPRTAHQQRVENLVQTAGFLGQTHVEEARRSARAKIHCLFLRDYNSWALEIVRQQTIEKQRKIIERHLQQPQPAQPQTSQLKLPKHVRRVEGKQNLELWGEWIDNKLDKIALAEGFLKPEGMKKLRDEIGNKKNKISASENDERLLRYKRAAKSNKDRSVRSKHLADINPWMDGSIILSYLSGKANAREFVMAEITERKIKMPKNTKSGDLASDWKDFNMLELRHLLRTHERARLLKEEDKTFAKESDVKYIKPFSTKMKEWMPRQWQIYKERKGIVIAEA
jgi:hypothetical protein